MPHYPEVYQRTRKPKTPPPPPDRLLKITEVAERLAVHRNTVYNMLDEEVLPFVPVGKSGKGKRVRESDLAAYINAAGAEAV